MADPLRKQYRSQIAGLPAPPRCLERDFGKPMSLEESRQDIREFRAYKDALEKVVSGIRRSLHDLEDELDGLDGELEDPDEPGWLTIATRLGPGDTTPERAVVTTTVNIDTEKLELQIRKTEEMLKTAELVVELKTSLLWLKGSMGRDDYDAAVDCVTQMQKIEFNRLWVQTAPRTPTHLRPREDKAVQEAKKNLCAIFVRQFERAATGKDHASVVQCFKLFALIDYKDAGLDMYFRRYLCPLMATIAPAMDRYRGASAVVIWLGHMSKRIETQAVIVEREYGRQHKLAIIRRLLTEVHVYGDKVLTAWAKNAKVSRLLAALEAYSQGQDDSTSGLSPVDACRVSKDMGSMLKAWFKFTQKVFEQCKGTGQVLEGEICRAPTMLYNSVLYHMMMDKVVKPFISLTIINFRRSILHEFEQNGRFGYGIPSPYANPAGGDFVTVTFDRIVSELIETQQLVVLTSLMPAFSRVLEADFVDIVRKKLVLSTYTKTSPPHRLLADDKISTYINLMNLLETVSTNLNYLVAYNLAKGGLSSSSDPWQDDPKHAFPSCPWPLPTAKLFELEEDCDLARVAAALQTLADSFSLKTKDVLKDASHALFINAIKPRLSTMLTAAFQASDYGAAEEVEGAAAAAGSVVRHFKQQWEQLMTSGISKGMAPRCYEGMLGWIVAHVALVLEERLWRFQEERIGDYGGICLKRDYLAIVDVVCEVRPASRSVFDKVLTTMSVMKVDEGEWVEVEA